MSSLSPATPSNASNQTETDTHAVGIELTVKTQCLLPDLIKPYFKARENVVTGDYLLDKQACEDDLDALGIDVAALPPSWYSDALANLSLCTYDISDGDDSNDGWYDLSTFFLEADSGAYGKEESGDLEDGEVVENEREEDGEITSRPAVDHAAAIGHDEDTDPFASDAVTLPPDSEYDSQSDGFAGDIESEDDFSGYSNDEDDTDAIDQPHPQGDGFNNAQPAPKANSATDTIPSSDNAALMWNLPKSTKGYAYGTKKTRALPLPAVKATFVDPSTIYSDESDALDIAATQSDASSIKITLKRQKQGSESKTRSNARRNKRRRVAPAANSDIAAQQQVKRHQRLLYRSRVNAQVVVLSSMDVVRDGQAAQTGWQGRPPPKMRREQILGRYNNGKINDIIAHFLPLPYVNRLGKEVSLWLLDQQERLFLYRAFAMQWSENDKVELFNLICQVLKSTLQSDAMRKKCKDGSRGPHFPSIMGHYRQSAKVPMLTAWHRRHQEEVEYFLNQEVVKRLNKFVASVTNMAFPGVKKRFDLSAAWHELNHGIKPLFDPFWNWCINGIFPGQERVHCLPHADSKNPISVCALMVYVGPNSKFNHKQRSWLVIWEAGVVIELPPWVLLIYPSSLFFHFNVDIHDIHFVVTEDGQSPLPDGSNCQPLQDDHLGRGSMVWFTMATMYQSSETGYNTLKEAKAAGHSGKTDGKQTARDAFQTYGKFVNLSQI